VLGTVFRSGAQKTDLHMKLQFAKAKWGSGVGSSHYTTSCFHTNAANGSSPVAVIATSPLGDGL
jgi:hypothetical protein